MIDQHWVLDKVVWQSVCHEGGLSNWEWNRFQNLDRSNNVLIVQWKDELVVVWKGVRNELVVWKGIRDELVIVRIESNGWSCEWLVDLMVQWRDWSDIDGTDRHGLRMLFNVGCRGHSKDCENDQKFHPQSFFLRLCFSWSKTQIMTLFCWPYLLYCPLAFAFLSLCLTSVQSLNFTLITFASQENHRLYLFFVNFKKRQFSVNLHWSLDFEMSFEV